MSATRTGQPTVTERLIAGARELLAREGADALTARRVASEAGRSTMCVYTAFGNVGGMLDAVYGELADEFVAAVEAAPDPAAAYRGWALRHPAFYHLLVDADASDSGVDRGRRSQLVADLGARLAPGSPERGAAVWAIVHGLVSLERIDGDATAATAALAPAAVSDPLLALAVAVN